MVKPISANAVPRPRRGAWGGLLPPDRRLPALLLCALLTAACGPREESPPYRADGVHFVPGAMLVHLPAGHGLALLDLLEQTAQGQPPALLLQQPVAADAPQTVRLDGDWAPGRMLLLRGWRNGKALPPLTLHTPSRAAPSVTVTLQLPLGIDLPADEAPLVLPTGSTGTLGLLLRSTVHRSQGVTLEVTLPPALRGNDLPATRRETLTLAFRDDLALVRVPFTVDGASPAEREAALSWRLHDAQGQLLDQGARAVTARSADDFRAALRLVESRFPADATGAAQPDLSAEQWTLEHPLVARFWAWLGRGTGRDPYAPIGYGAHHIENSLPGTVLVATVQTVRRPDGGVAPAFANPLAPAGGASLALQPVSPGGSTPLAQPLYLAAEGTAPGIYQRCVRLVPWGLEAAATESCHPLLVQASPLGNWLLVWLATLASVAVLTVALVRLPRWIGRFALRDLILIALLAGTAFVVVTVPNVPFQALTTLLLGPFFFLLDDLLYKGVLFLLVGVLAVLVRRPGTYLLFYVLWMLGQATLQGQYSPVMLLFSGITVLLLEAALWLSGITRPGAPLPGAWRAALLVGLAEGAVIVWHMALIKVLYRVYLADWFVLLHGLSGALHAGLGLRAGLALGDLLRPLRRPALPLPEAPRAQDRRMRGEAEPPQPTVAPGTPVLTATGLAMTYPGAPAPALHPIDLTLHAGEIVLLGGPSGSGKTTLLRQLQGLLPIPGGASLRLHGRDSAAMPRADWVRQCGLLFQEPALQVVRPTVAGDVAFSRDLRGEPAGEATSHPAVAAALETFGIGHLQGRGTGAVSGGELQRVALAGLWVERPAVLLLDEPLAHQDEPGRERLRAELAALSKQGSAVLVAEHRLTPLLPVAHRVLWLEGGRVLWQGSVQAFARQPQAQPAPIPGRAGAAPAPDAADTAPLVTARQLRYSREKAGPPILAGIDLRVPPGRRIALTGANGAGKSTLLSLLVGLRRPGGGSVLVGDRPAHRLSWRERARRFGYVPQQAELVLQAPTAREELAFAPRQRGASPAEADALAERWLDALGLRHATERFPHLLSRGERQRLALAAVLAGEPVCLVLDEPFAGQDVGHMATLLALCEGHLAQDARRSIVVATHDLAAVRHWFDEVWTLADGALSRTVVGQGDGPQTLPREVPA